MTARNSEARTKPSMAVSGNRETAACHYRRQSFPRGTACGDVRESWLLQRLSPFSPREQQRTLSASAPEPAIPWVLDLSELPQATLTATVSWISLWPIPAAGASVCCSEMEMAPFDWRRTPPRVRHL